MKHIYLIFIFTIILLGNISVSHAGAPVCSVQPVDKNTVFLGEIENSTSVNPVLEEHQILNVETWRGVLSGSVASSSNPIKTAGLALFLKGSSSPSTDVTNAIIEFIPTGQKVRAPTYSPPRKQIRFQVNVEHFEPLMSMLDNCAPFYMQYRRYDNGHVFADFHMGEVPVGE